uniref:DNA polymerase II subunit 2 n=1 Tax=Rhabditophanes sp. KR3021 TaxID=114890 RepID=A0AC35TI65_9BILA
MDKDKANQIKKVLKGALMSKHLASNREVDTFLIEQFKDFDNERIKAYVDKISAIVRAGVVDVNILTMDSLQKILVHFNTLKDDNLKVITLTDGFTVNSDGVKSGVKKDYIGTVEEICSVQRNRLGLVQKLVTSDESYIVGPIPGKLMTIEALLGYRRFDELVSILACGYKCENSVYVVEDMSGSLSTKLLDKCSYGRGILLFGAPLMFTGKFSKGILSISRIELPPSVTVPRPITKSVIKDNEKFLFLSDVHLDNGNTMRAIHQLLHGFSSCMPKCIVLIGNFLTNPLFFESLKEYEEGFKKLAHILSTFPQYSETTFIMVPGNLDLPSSIMYPKLPIIKKMQKYFEKQKNVIFTSNPTILTYKSQRILVSRNNEIIEKMCHDAFHIPKDISKITAEFAETIVQMRHIQPLPTHIAPVYPNYDEHMSLEQLPDLIVLGDKFKHYEAKVQDCIIANPGSFHAGTKFEFMTYYNKDKVYEYSAIN